MIKKPRTEWGRAAESSSAKKAKVASEAESAGSKITVTLDPKLLKCSVCCSTLVPPLFQCTAGHLTCLGCDDCSLCGEPSNIRCHSVELIVGGMTLPCSFREHGCTDMIPFADMLAHEESCLHAPCYCPIAGCRPYACKSLHKHLVREHSGIQLRLSHVTAGILCPVQIHNRELAHFVFLEGRGETFLLVVDRSVPSGRGLSVIPLASEPAGLDDFKFKIEVYTRRGILCLSSETQSVWHLSKPYQAGASLFVSDAMWSPEDSPVYIQLS